MVSDNKLTAAIAAIFGVIAILIIIVLTFMFVPNYFLVGIQQAHAATLNTTAQLPVPISVSVNDGSQKGAVAATPVDTATIGSLAAMGVAMAYRWKKGDKREVVGAQTDAQIANSLKNTDVGVHQSLCAINKAIGLIPGVPQEAKDLITAEMNAWNKDVNAYYNTSTPNPAKLSGDPVIQSQAQTQDITVKSED